MVKKKTRSQVPNRNEREVFLLMVNVLTIND